MKKFFVLAMFSFLVFVFVPSVCFSQTSEDMSFEEKVLKALKDNKIELVNIVEQGAQARQEKSRKEALEKSLSTTVEPEINSSDIVLGSSNSKNMIVVYSSFECPHCAKAHDTLYQMTQDNDDISLVVKVVPSGGLDMGLSQVYTAFLSQDKGTAYDYLHYVYKNIEKIQDDQQVVNQYVDAHVNGLKVDKEDFEGYLNSQASQKIQGNKDEYERLGFQGVPIVVVNGHPFVGAHPSSVYEKALKK